LAKLRKLLYIGIKERENVTTLTARQAGSFLPAKIAA
jgi:hypothetical protein